MLNFNLRAGDDVWFGLDGQPLDQWQQIICKSVDGAFLTVFTPSEVLEVLLGDSPMDSGVHDVKIAAKADLSGDDTFMLGIEAPQSVKIMRGRVYRRELNG